MDIISAVASNPTNITVAEFVKLTVYNEYTPVVATAIVEGTSYQILTIGTTDWTTLGAPNNNYGTIFVANANGTSGSGTGTAYNVSVYTFSSSYKYETIDGFDYSPMGGLLGIGIQQRDLRATSSQTSISLSGISGNNIYIVLATKVQGAIISIIRGFYDNNYNLTSTANRFTGIVTSYNITEDRKDESDNFTVTLSANSFKAILENRVTGRKTNHKSWQKVNPTDSSMNNVDSIANQFFDFGLPPGTIAGDTGGTSAGQLTASLIPASRVQN